MSASTEQVRPASDGSPAAAHGALREDGPPPLGTRSRVLVGMVGLAAALLSWWRLTPIARDTLWAEDGRIFLTHASALPAHATLTLPHGGYLHVVPRLVAEAVAGLVPVAGWALAVTAASCLLAGVVAASVAALARDVVPWAPARLALAFATAAAPLAHVEVLGNLANLHWLLLWLMPWLLLAPGGRTRRQWALGAAVLLVVTSEVQAVIFAPLALWRVRRRGGIPRLVALVAGLALQVRALMGEPRGTNGGTVPAAGEIVASWLHVVALPWVVPPHRALAGGPQWQTVAAGAVVVVVVAAAIASAVRFGSRRQMVVAVTSPLVAAALWVVAVVMNTPVTRSPDGAFLSLRYGYAPSLCLATTIAVGLAALPRGRYRWIALGVLALPATVALATSPVLAAGRDGGPEWRPAVEVAEQTCSATPPPPVAVIPISPPRWTTIIDCARLEP